MADMLEGSWFAGTDITRDIYLTRRESLPRSANRNDAWVGGRQCLLVPIPILFDYFEAVVVQECIQFLRVGKPAVDVGLFPVVTFPSFQRR